MAVSERSLVSLAGWPLGLDNISNEAEVKPKALREAVNVDIGRGGELHRRRGYTLRVAGTAVHSITAVGSTVLFVDGDTLYLLDTTDWSTTELLTGLTNEARMSYAQAEDKIYFANGSEIGAVDVRTGTATGYLGVPDPGGQPVVSVTGFGGLGAGQYLVAITLLAEDGTESGSTLSVSAAVPEGGGITLTGLPAPTGASKLRVYLSNPNGGKEELWQHSDHAIGTATVQLGPRVPGRPLTTQFLSPLPAGQHIRLFHGRLYVAVDNVLVYSDPFRRHLYAPDDNFYVFPERITAVEPVDGGIFVASDQLYFLAGTDPRDFQQRRVYPTSIAEGSSLRIPGTVFPSLQIAREVAYFYSSRGPLVGLPDGAVVLPLEARVAGDMQPYGATLLREQEGIRQLVTSLYGTPDTSGFRASDYSVITIKRNGVEI